MTKGVKKFLTKGIKISLCLIASTVTLILTPPAPLDRFTDLAAAANSSSASSSSYVLGRLTLRCEVLVGCGVVSLVNEGAVLILRE